jgi:hypothetical protein
LTCGRPYGLLSAIHEDMLTILETHDRVEKHSIPSTWIGSHPPGQMQILVLPLTFHGMLHNRTSHRQFYVALCSLLPNTTKLHIFFPIVIVLMNAASVHD